MFFQCFYLLRVTILVNDLKTFEFDWFVDVNWLNIPKKNQYKSKLFGRTCLRLALEVLH